MWCPTTIFPNFEHFKNGQTHLLRTPTNKIFEFSFILLFYVKWVNKSYQHVLQNILKLLLFPLLTTFVLPWLFSFWSLKHTMLISSWVLRACYFLCLEYSSDVFTLLLHWRFRLMSRIREVSSVHFNSSRILCTQVTPLSLHCLYSFEAKEFDYFIS